ncbi:MAG: hypothetical protein ABIO35_10190, partial [Nitrobacter sp.]
METGSRKENARTDWRAFKRKTGAALPNAFRVDRVLGEDTGADKRGARKLPKSPGPDELAVAPSPKEGGGTARRDENRRSRAAPLKLWPEVRLRGPLARRRDDSGPRETGNAILILTSP